MTASTTVFMDFAEDLLSGHIYSRASGPGPVDMVLGPGFEDLDAVRFAIILPLDQINVLGQGDEDPKEPNQLWCALDYCTNFAISSMQATAISPVPLPAALPLLAAGLGGLGFMGRRKKKAA